MSAPATTEKKYLKWYQKLAYGSGDLASNCLLYTSVPQGMEHAHRLGHSAV